MQLNIVTLLVVVAMLSASRLAAATFTVTTTNNAGAGSLSEAITLANASPGHDFIHFNLAPTGIVHVIQLAGGLPPVTDPVTIDGLTQPGALPNSLPFGFNATNLVTLDGDALTNPPPVLPPGGDPTTNVVHGLDLRADGITVRGLRLVHFVSGGDVTNCRSAIFVRNVKDTVIESCVFGVTADTSLAAINYGAITVFQGAFTRIGGPNPAQRNLMASNPGWQIRLLDSVSNVVAGNFIGQPGQVPAALIAPGPGVVLERGYHNRIGGAAAGEGNFFSHVGGNILHDLRGAVHLRHSHTNEVLGNWFGLQPPEVMCLLPGGPQPCGIGVSGVNLGVLVEESHDNRIGGPAAGDGNIMAAAQTAVDLRGTNCFNNRVQGNRIGTHPDGTAGSTFAFSPANSANQEGVVVQSEAHDNLIGGPNPGEGNLIANNLGHGVVLRGTNTALNRVFGNFIGTDLTGTNALPNGVFGGSGDGVFLADGTSHNEIGGPNPGEGNLISGNHNHGVHLTGEGTRTNRVRGNVIGPDLTGTRRLPYQPPLFNDRGNILSGVRLSAGAAFNQIGGPNSGEGNLISANGGDGVTLSDTGGDVSENEILGNRIGTDAAGLTVLPNDLDGVRVQANRNWVGRDLPGGGNLISGNLLAGVRVLGHTNFVRANRIGTDTTGTLPLPNAVGVRVEGRRNHVGGASAAAGNLISGNSGHGVAVFTAPSFSGITEAVGLIGNRIGTGLGGTNAVPNGTNGVHISGAPNCSLWDNLVSGNAAAGVVFHATTNGLLWTNIIGADLTGTNPLPNAGPGILLDSCSHVQVGDTGIGFGNRIAYNGDHGVLVRGGALGNSCFANSIFANAGLGINLEAFTGPPSGVTPNDLLDFDSGPNSLQNFPVLTNAVAGANTVLHGSLHSTPLRAFTVELFRSAAPDLSGHGEGEVFVTRATVTTDAAGAAPISFTVGGSWAGHWFTATATDQTTGDTSEFGPALLVPPPLQFTVARQDETDFEAGFHTLLGLSYTVLANTNLASTNWVVFTNLTGDGTLRSFRVPTSAEPQRYFRLRHP